MDLNFQFLNTPKYILWNNLWQMLIMKKNLFKLMKKNKRTQRKEAWVWKKKSDIDFASLRKKNLQL